VEGIVEVVGFEVGAVEAFNIEEGAVEELELGTWVVGTLGEAWYIVRILAYLRLRRSWRYKVK